MNVLQAELAQLLARVYTLERVASKNLAYIAGADSPAAVNVNKVSPMKTWTIARGGTDIPVDEYKYIAILKGVDDVYEVDLTGAQAEIAVTNGDGVTDGTYHFYCKITATNYIYMKIKDSGDGSAATASLICATTAHTADADYVARTPHYHFIPIAQATLNDGVIDPRTIKIGHAGPIGVFIGGTGTPDDLSINLNGDDELQIYDWDVAADSGESIDIDYDLFIYQSNGHSRALEYRTLTGMAPYIGAALEAVAWEPWTAMTHDQLYDILNDEAGDDHVDDGPESSTGNFSYLANKGDAERNYMDVGLGDSTGIISVAVNARKLYESVGSGVRVDWEAAELGDIPWSVTNDTDADGAAGGALSIAGGLDVAKKIYALTGFYLDAAHYITPTNCYLEPTGSFTVSAAGDVTLESLTAGVHASGDNATLYAPSGILALEGNSFAINGDPYALINVIAPIAAGGPLHSLTVLAKDNGTI